MNSTSEENGSSDDRVITEKTEPDKSLDELLMPAPSIGDITDDSTVSYTSSVKCLTRDSLSISPVKRDSISPIKSIKDDSCALASDSPIAINEEVSLDPRSSLNLTDSVDLGSGKCMVNSSDIVLVEDEKSTDTAKITDGDSSSKRILEISGSSDVHIVESPDTNNIDSKSLNDSVQIITSDHDASIVLSDSDLPKPLASTDSFKKLVAEDPEKFISPVFADSKSSDRMNFDTQPAYSTPNEIEVAKTESEEISSQMRDSTESLTSLLPPMYKKMGFYVELSAAIHMNKELWSGEITNISFDMITNESSTTVPTRLSDTSGHLGDVSKSVSPAFSSSMTMFPLKPRISMASSSSSSSGLSSASTLARKLRDSKLLNRNKKDDVKLTDEYMHGLYEKWNHPTDVCNKFLAFIDRNILNSDSITKDDSLKTKLPTEEPKELKETKEPLAKIVEVTTPVSTIKVRQTRGKRQAKVKFTTDSESEVPKKRQRRAESTDVTTPKAKLPSKYSAGDSVFAKWGDRKFYAATLGEMTIEGKWQVNFFDGDKKTLLEEFLIKAGDNLIMVGSNVYASQGDDNFTPGIITGMEMKDQVLQYIVARDKGDISVPCQFIYITESQARQIRAKAPTTMRAPMKTNDVIMSPGSKRSTRSKTRQLLDSPKPSVSGTQQAQSQLSDTDDEENDDNNELNLEDVAGVEPESHGVYENGIKLKGKTLAGKMRFAKANKVSDADASVLGPIPDEGSKYFKNLHVLLTCTRPQSPKLPAVDDGSSAGNATSSESESFNFSKKPFVKDRLKLQLQMGGANVYNNFDDIPQKYWKNTYLISNRPNMSARYVQCLAAGIRVLCHEWVIRCCIDKKKVSLQELPLGWSLERERYFHVYDRKSSNALKKINLLIADTGDKSFLKFWTKICKLADINVAKLTRDSNLEQVTAIISESGYRDEHLERALSHTIPVVTTTWLIQSLLHGEPRKYDGHKNYLTEYVDSD